MSGETNIQRLRNYLREKREEVFYEQTPEVQQRTSRFGDRLRNLNKKYNPVKREKIPGGREFIKRHVIGSVTDLAGAIDGKHAVRRTIPKAPPRRKKSKRKSRVVG